MTPEAERTNPWLCRFWHRWGQWSKPAHIHVQYFSDGQKQSEGIESRQYRTCDRCKFTQVRTVEE